MVYQYLVYTEEKKLVKGTLSADSEKSASQMLAHKGYRVLSLKPVASSTLSLEKLFPTLYRIKPEAIIMFSRQLALLLESGVDIVTALELLQAQTPGRNTRKVLEEVISELRAGTQLSAALSKHPESFPTIYCRSLGVGEQTGSLETVLRQMADYIEKEVIAAKEIKNALRYPVIVSIVAVIVIAVIAIFVLPTFATLYSQLGAELPLITRLLLSSVSWFTNYVLYIVGAILLIALLGFLYIKTPDGGLAWDKMLLGLPILGRVRHLDELARCCRSMSLLFRAGLPLPEIMSLVTESSDNKVVKNVLNDVQQDMLKGEGLSRPMAKNKLFLPLMVQMVGVGEKTGNLDVTLTAVAQYFEAEAKDKMHSFIGLIQPAITLGIGIVVALIALSMMSAMYSLYGQML